MQVMIHDIASNIVYQKVDIKEYFSNKDKI